MDSLRQVWVTPILLLAALNGPVAAQVEKVDIRTTGISCGVCAAVSEVQFRRMPDISKVAISLPKETITLSYKPGAAFGPRQIREVLQPLDVVVVHFQISARGRVQEEREKRYFLAGKDKFVLAGTSSIAADGPLFIEGIVNDRIEPMELKVLNSRPLK